MNQRQADVIVVGAGPAGLALAAELASLGVNVTGLAPHPPDHPLPNTYGIWVDELLPLGLDHLLAHRWPRCVTYFHAADGRARSLPLDRAYGLFDNARLQTHLLTKASAGPGSVQWVQGYAARTAASATGITLTLRSGNSLHARAVVDATGHHSTLIQRHAMSPMLRGTARPISANRVLDRIAYQTAYGVVGRFSAPPVRADQPVLMDYRADHLTRDERHREPPTFLYAMHLGGDRYFVEETSLAHTPPVALPLLEARLRRRLAWHGIDLIAAEHIERCFFPMNLPLPNLRQPLVGFGGAAAMVHPASGYQMDSVLQRAPLLARALAAAMNAPGATPTTISRAAWQAVWPRDRLRRHQLYRFGLETLLTFDEAALHAFFITFFSLPGWMWRGYLSNTLSTGQLMRAMLALFARAPRPVRAHLAQSLGSHAGLLGRAFLGLP